MSNTARGESVPRKRHVEFGVAKTVIAITLLAGCITELKLPHTGFSIAFYLVALLSTSILPQRGAVVLVALLATLFNLTPDLWHSYANDLPLTLQARHYVWIGALWACAALLIWDPRRKNLSLDELQDAFLQAPAATALVDLKGRLLRANAAFEELSGLKRENIEGMYLQQLAGVDIWESFGDWRAELLGRIDKADKAIQFDQEITRHDGKKLWLSIYTRILKNEAGKPIMAMLQLLDFSEKRQAQRALGISESRFRGIIENTAEMIFIIDIDGTLTYANPAACTVLGVKRKFLIGHSPLQYIHYDDRRNVARRLKQSFHEPHKNYTIERVQLAHDETETYLEMQLTGLVDTPGIHGTVATCRVITQHLADQKKVRLSEAKFSSIFHSTPDAILIIRYRDSTILDFNTSFTRLLGYTREEAIGESEPDLGLWYDTLERDAMLESLKTEGDYSDQEVALLAKNGERVNTEISIRFMEYDGELCTICIGRDITEKQQALTALRESEAKFARIFSHSPDSIIIIRISDLMILDANDIVESNSGYRRVELVGKSLHELDIFDQDMDFEEVGAALLGNGGAQGIDLGLKTREGEVIPTLVSASLIEWDGEDALLCIAKDHRAQQKAEDELRTSEERFRGAFEHSPIGIMMVDVDGRILKANRFAAELLAYEAGELPGVHLSRLIPVAERKNLKETLVRLLHSNRDFDHSERRMTRHNSLEIWTNFHTVLLRSPEGTPLYYIVQIADITEMKDNHQRMERMAFYDSLTDLANRRLFSDRLEHAIQRSKRSGKAAALLYLDLDQFKRVNDTLGHECGDELLREVSRRLQLCVRQEDTVARPGGDEFTILLYDINGPRDASLVADKILSALRKPIRIADHELIVTTSIGITIIPDDSLEPNILTKSADLAMYRAKDRGRNNYQFFSEDMNSNAESRLRIENEMHQALKKDEFKLYFQPKVALDSQNIVGVEALLRWNHPKRGMIGPNEYIPIAEETGIIVEIGAWVIEEACKAARKFTQQHESPITVAVNISARQFKDPHLVTVIRRCIRESGIKPEGLEIEITETMLMGDVDAALVTVQRLHELGIKLAIDDFGTGYSSLNYLKRFPIDTVKIDRSFVTDIPGNSDDMTITAAVIAMAHRLNMQVVAEGIETPEQLAFLNGHNCEFGQGYYFSKPLSFEDIHQLLDPNIRLMRNPGNFSA